MMKKRIFSILLALTLCLSLLPTAVFAGEDDVAQIGDQGYATLEGAISKAEKNDTIKLLQDVSSTSALSLTLKQGTTLDGDGHTVSGNICFHVAAAGGVTIQNVNFKDIHNETAMTDAQNTRYGFTNKTGSLTAVYASGLSGSLSITGCTFENVDWDAIQITPVAGANITVTGNTFTTSEDCQTVRFVHIESAQNVDFTATITGNQFKNVAYLNQTGIEVYYPTDASKITVNKNYMDAPMAVCVGTGGTSWNNAWEKTYPFVDADMTTEITPVVAIFNNTKGGTMLYKTEAEAAEAGVVAVSNGVGYTSLATAVSGAADGATIKLLDDTDCAGIVFPEATFTTSGLTIDLNGKTLTLKDPMVGSAGTETNGFQILKGNKVTIQNGTIQSSAAKYLIQNYSDLTLDGVTLNGSDLKANSSNYTLSNNCGTVEIKNSTIIAKEGQYAFDVYGGFGSYSDVSVEVENSTINGNIEVARANTTNNNNNSLYFKSGELNGEIVKRNSCTDNTTISISGGYFTADPSAYKADGYYVRPVDEADEHYGDYNYIVNDTEPETQYVFINGDTAAEIKEGLTSNIDDPDYPNNLKNNTVVMAEVALDEDALYDSLSKDISNAGVVRVEVKVAVTVTAADLSSEGEGTMTFTATPTATVYADGQQVGSTTVTNDMLTGEGITVYLPLPSGFTPKQIKHISANGSVEYFINATEGSKRGAKTFTIDPVDPDDPEGDRCAVFEITHFSKFVLTGTVDYVEPAIPSKPANDVTISSGLYGSVTANQTEAREGSIVTVTVTPNAGYALDELTVTDAKGNALTVTSIGGGKYTFIMPNGKVTVRATFTDGQNTGFVDVPANKYFYDAVNWAVANGITSGVDSTHFAPYASCTRGQLVTFLWRAAGQPAAKATENAFSDVKEGSSFYKAILWAAENGIVNGYSDGTFKPNASVTRQQTAAILYRYAKYAKMDVSVGEDTNILSFNDAFSVSEYAIAAFQWATGEKVITGNAGNLLPHDTCTRAQIVTMLYRLLGK